MERVQRSLLALSTEALPKLRRRCAVLARPSPGEATGEAILGAVLGRFARGLMVRQVVGIGIVYQSTTTTAILACLGLPTRAPPTAPALPEAEPPEPQTLARRAS